MEFPILPGLADAPTNATDFGVKKVSMKSLFGFAFEKREQVVRIFGGIGWTTIPMLIGAYAGRTSVQKSFRVAAASAVGLCVIATILRSTLAG